MPRFRPYNFRALANISGNIKFPGNSQPYFKVKVTYDCHYLSTSNFNPLLKTFLFEPMLYGVHVRLLSYKVI